MPTKGVAAYVPSMSDDAVRAKTGKAWPEWFAILDREGGRRMDHKQIVAVLHGKYALGPWWQQMVTVTYEQARGLRAVHETTTGFTANVSRTINVPRSKLYNAWKDGRARARWMGKSPFTVRKATPGKSMRLTWEDGKTYIDVGFYTKGDNKAQVTLQASRLPNAAAVKRQKAFWTKALTALRAQLEA